MKIFNKISGTQVQSPIIFITGQPGVGKTTIARRIAGAVSKSICISLDDIRQMVRGGYVDPATNSWEVFEEQYVLSQKAVLELASVYVSAGFTVVIEGAVFEDTFDLFAQRYSASNLHLFLLTASKKELQKRKAQRKNNVPETQVVTDMLILFDELESKMKHKNFHSVKNTQVEKTVQNILKKI